MVFFKDFKDDFSQAVNELLPDDSINANETEEQIVNTLDTNNAAADDISGSEKMKEWLDELENIELEVDRNEEVTIDTTEDAKEDLDTTYDNENALKHENTKEEGASMDDNVDLELLNSLSEEEKQVEDTEKEQKVKAASVSKDEEVSIITKGTSINGSITSDNSLDVYGDVTGDIECLGKLSITGKVIGNVSAAEVYINTERMEGNVVSEGTVKIGLGTVLIGDVTGTSGVIAGAVKGEIDINGPVVIDSTAIIKGNIKAKSVQINNGAIIDGFCSLTYSDVNIDNIFE